jgi:hypothetical protein
MPSSLCLSVLKRRIKEMRRARKKMREEEEEKEGRKR